jgi:hypothetical protein
MAAKQRAAQLHDAGEKSPYQKESIPVWHHANISIGGSGVVRSNGVVARARHVRGISKPHQNVPHNITSSLQSHRRLCKLDGHLLLPMLALFDAFAKTWCCP